MRNADKKNAQVVLILGEDELRQRKVAWKDMKEKKEDVLVELDSVVKEVREKLC